MKVEMVRCDNPACKSIGHPESRKPYVAPYGWLHIQRGWFVGCGPNVQVEVCSVECLTPAVEELVRRDRDGG